MSTRTVPDREIRALIDRMAILDLCARYTHTGNAHDAEAHGATFTSDGVLETVDENGEPIEGWVMKGPAAVADLVRRSPPGPVEITSDAQIEIEGDTATGTSSFLFGMRARDRKSFRIVTTGRYRDRFRRTAEGWRIERRTVQLDIGIEEFVRAMMAGA
jgi:ketosteroid isomerase-like protein